MKGITLKEFIKLNFGLLLYGLSMVFAYQANIGYAPWDVFHVGFSKITGLSVGQASILVGFFILIFIAINKVPIGLGTILNMLVIGLYFDLIMLWGLVPLSIGLIHSLIYALISMVLASFAIYFYVSTAYGAGPRDSLFFFISKNYKLSLGLSRILIESIVVLLGFIMGGKVGLGTLIFAFLTGHVMNLIFKILNFLPATIVHRTFKS